MTSTSNHLERFRVVLRQTEDRPTLREECRVMLESGVAFSYIARTIWDHVSEKSVADFSWLPAASCVNHADMYAHVQLHESGDKHRVITFGGPIPEFRRTQPPPLKGSLDELRSRFCDIASAHDWQLTERCLLGIPKQSGIVSTFSTILDHLLQSNFIGTTAGPWWAELRHVTIGCLIETRQRFGRSRIASTTISRGRLRQHIRRSTLYDRCVASSQKPSAAQ